MKRLVNICENPNMTILSKVENYFSPKEIIIYAEENTYKINDYIYKNTRILNNIVSVSGYVTKIVKDKNLDKLTITNDYQENALKKERRPRIKDKKDLLNFLNEENENKLFNKFNLDNISNLVISTIDEEIYDASETIYLENNTRLIMETIEKILNILNLDYAILFIKSTSFKSIKKSSSIIGSYPKIKIVFAPDKYLIGHKDFACEYLNMEIKETVLLKTEDIIALSSILENKKIVEKIVAICDNTKNKGIVVNTRLGVTIQELLTNYFDLNGEYLIYLNGLLGGKKILSTTIVERDTSSIIVASPNEDKETECINCGACLRICPYNIKVKLYYEKNIASKKCINCGLCNYICPAQLKLKEVVGDNNE